MQYATSKISEKKVNEMVWMAQVKLNKNAFQHLYILMNEWMNAVVWKTKQKFPTIPLKLADIQSYKDFSFFISVMQFDFEKNIPFPQFVIQQLKWFLLSQLRIFVRNKFKILNYSSIYIDEKFFHKNNSSKKLKTPNYDDFNYYKKFLKKIEKKIFDLKIKKYKNKEIASKLKITSKKVDNNWQNIKKKLRNSLIF